MSRFVDLATVVLRSGAGGAGAVSFAHQRRQPRGGPDGGDGGNGGDVICYLDGQLSSLEHVAHRARYAAGDGEGGKGEGKHGGNGKDCLIGLPDGTIVRRRAEAGANAMAGVAADAGAAAIENAVAGTGAGAEILCEISGETPRHTMATGGRGGLGNMRFKTAHNRTPRHAQPGEPSERITVEFELRMRSDVALVGMPNAGKSSVLRAMTKARPAVERYPFTSHAPTLGVIELPDRSVEPLIGIDLPGLVAGAARGRGLGNGFLRHAVRAQTIGFVLEAERGDGLSVAEQARILCDELRAYDAGLLEKRVLVIINKDERAGGESAREWHGDIVAGAPLVSCSALRGTGIAELIAALYRMRSAGGEG